MNNQINKMDHYCVICGKFLKSSIQSCCTQNSLVKINKVGLLKKRIEYFDSEGNILNEDELREIKERETLVKNHICEKVNTSNSSLQDDHEDKVINLSYWKEEEQKKVPATDEWAILGISAIISSPNTKLDFESIKKVYKQKNPSWSGDHNIQIYCLEETIDVDENEIYKIAYHFLKTACIFQTYWVHVQNTKFEDSGSNDVSLIFLTFIFNPDKGDKRMSVLAPNWSIKYTKREKYDKMSPYQLVQEKLFSLEIIPIRNYRTHGELKIDYHVKGDSKLELEDYLGAIFNYSIAIEQAPDNASLYNKRGVVKAMIGDYSGALTDYNNAIKLDPNDYMTYCNRGSILKITNDIKKAILDFDKAIELNPNNALAYLDRAHSKTFSEDYIGAISDYSKAIELEPSNENAYASRSKARYKTGDTEGAISDLSQVIKLNPNDSNVYCFRGYLKLTNSDISGYVDLLRAKELGNNMADKLIKEFFQ